MRRDPVSRFLAPFSLLLVLSASPLLNGCSTFGIAKADDLAAVENRLEAQNRSSNARVTDVEKQLDLMDQTVQKLQTDDARILAELDSLETRFKKAREWLQGLNIEDIAGDLKTARIDSQDAKSGNVELTRHFLAKMHEDQKALEAHIQTLEALLASLKGTDKTPAASGASAEPAATVTDSKETSSGDND